MQGMRENIYKPDHKQKNNKTICFKLREVKVSKYYMTHLTHSLVSYERAEISVIQNSDDSLCLSTSYSVTLRGMFADTHTA